MKVKILGWDSIYNADDYIEDAKNVWVSPDKTALIMERYKSELFVAARILEYNEERYICEYQDCYMPLYMGLDLCIYDVDWEFLKTHGFAKLTVFELEGGGVRTDRRFYF